MPHTLQCLPDLILVSQKGGLFSLNSAVLWNALFIIYFLFQKLLRNVPSRAALSVIKPALGRQQSISDRAKAAMQGYLNLFFSNLDIVNSREVNPLLPC
jgi:hypothetical protein